MRRIQRYKNRKLYDSQEKRYINMGELMALVVRGENVQVDDKTLDRDLTGSVLAEAISRRLRVKNNDRAVVVLTMLIREMDPKAECLESP